jgi:hypothetical protein
MALRLRLMGQQCRLRAAIVWLQPVATIDIVRAHNLEHVHTGASLHYKCCSGRSVLGNDKAWPARAVAQSLL